MSAHVKFATHTQTHMHVCALASAGPGKQGRLRRVAVRDYGCAPFRQRCWKGAFVGVGKRRA